MSVTDQRERTFKSEARVDWTQETTDSSTSWRNSKFVGKNSDFLETCEKSGIDYLKNEEGIDCQASWDRRFERNYC